MNAHAIQRIFLIMMSNQDWASVKGNASAPYINNTLLPTSSYAENYYDNPNGVHPSEPNYIWLEAGDNLGIVDNNPPATNHQATTQHLVSLLTAAGVSWHAYVEDITSGRLSAHERERVRPQAPPDGLLRRRRGQPDVAHRTVLHVERPAVHAARRRSREQLRRPVQLHRAKHVRRHEHGDGLRDHGSGCQRGHLAVASDTDDPPRPAVQERRRDLRHLGSEHRGGEAPIGMIVQAPAAKGGGYSNTIKYYHSSMLRTVQEVFGVTPLLRDAANQTSLSDLFTAYP